MPTVVTGVKYNTSQYVVIFVSENSLLSDSALSDIDEDQLGYGEFAVELADLIQNDVPRDGFVVSVNGQWGSGKSTILNFLETELAEGPESPTTMRFNPWWFSGEADLINSFLEEFGATLGNGGQHDEIREKLATYAKAVSKVPLDVSGVPASKVVEASADLVEPNEKTTTELKSSIEDTIQDEYDHIVVFIDEIDRLTNRETSQVFKLVKSVADFPNTTYVLAFSRDVVTDALQADENPHRVENGDEFLDKIVQLPRQVPVPKRGSLRRMLEQGLQQIASDDTAVEDDRASNIITAICDLVETPRDVTRLLNSVQSSYRVLDADINFLDIVALETIREYSELVFDKIRQEPDLFARIMHGPGSTNQEEDNWEENLRDPVINLISDLFPNWREVNFAMSDEMEFEYRESNRVAHPDNLHRYLRKTIPDEQYSSSEITDIMRATNNEDAFTSVLRKKLLGAKSDPMSNRVLLSELVASRSKIRESKPVLRGIFNIADELIRLDDRPISRFETTSATYLLYLYRCTGNWLGSTGRENIIEAMADGESIYFPWYAWNKEGSNRSNSDIRNTPFEPEKGTILDIIEELANEKRRNNTLVDVPQIYDLFEVLNQEDDQFVTDWLGNVLTDEDRLPRLLVGLTRSGRMNGQPVYYLDATDLGKYADLTTAQTTVSSLSTSDFNERTKRSIECFQKAMELIEKDKDPGRIKNWNPAE